MNVLTGSHSRSPSFFLGVIWLGLLTWFLASCEASDSVTPVPTVLPLASHSVVPSPTRAITLTPTLAQQPDPRIAEYETRFGIQFLDKSCAAPCQNIVGVRVLVEPLRLGDWVQKFGRPDKVIGYVRRGKVGDDIAVELYYVNAGLHLQASRPWTGRAEVTPDMVIDQFDFLTARSLVDMAMEMRLLYGTSRELDQAMDWAGFGPIVMLGR